MLVVVVVVVVVVHPLLEKEVAPCQDFRAAAISPSSNFNLYTRHTIVIFKGKLF